MKEFFRSHNVSWLVIGLVGLGLILFRRPLENFLYILLGLGLLLTAGAGLFNWFQTRSRTADGIIQLVGCAIVALIGIWILTHPDAFRSLLNWAIGLVLIISGGTWLARNEGFRRSTLVGVLAVVAVVAGLCSILFGHMITWLLYAAGLALIYTAVTGWFSEKILS